MEFFPFCLQKIFSSWIWMIILAGIGLQVAKWVYRTFKYHTIINKIPGFTGIPIIGNIKLLLAAKICGDTMDMMNNMHEICQGLSEIYPKEKIYRLWLVGVANVFIYSSNLVETVFNCKSYEKPEFMNMYTKALFGTKALLIAKRAIWSPRRKMINPVFHTRKLLDLMPSLNRKSHQCVKIMKNNLSESGVDIVPIAGAFTYDLLTENFLGTKEFSQDNHYTHFLLKCLDDATYCIYRRCMRPWLNPDVIYKRTSDGNEFYRSTGCLNKVTRELVEKKFQENHNSLEEETEKEEIHESNENTLINFLMEKHNQDPTSNLIDVSKELNLFMSAGHDTTHLNLVYTLYLLGLDQEIQDKVYEEISQMFNETNPSISYEETLRLTYLDMVIKESLRLFPPISGISRILEEDIILDKYTIPKDTQITINIFKLHRDPAVFPDPEKFIPERFAPENLKHITPYSYMPFSTGTRNCIGKYMGLLIAKVFLAHLLLNFKIESLDPRDKLLLAPAMTLKPKIPVFLKFHPRN